MKLKPLEQIKIKTSRKSRDKKEPIIHLHRYERSSDNKKIYRCVDPDCSHYNSRALLKGKRALCFKCFEPFILNIEQLKNKHPVCDRCTKSTKGIRPEGLELLKELFPSEEVPFEKESVMKSLGD